MIGTAIRSFLGPCNMIGYVVPSFAHLVTPVSEQSRKYQPTQAGALVEQNSGAISTLKSFNNADLVDSPKKPWPVQYSYLYF